MHRRHHGIGERKQTLDSGIPGRPFESYHMFRELQMVHHAWMAERMLSVDSDMKDVVFHARE